ncbi:hypothetical protein TVAG_278360 [Trichomonas vaginalis G3]|uniref:DUF3447 domain-containing protein n=1 Tax=Trichomonas vaginalis (strain ATCC PRA-98 / G3) TaxID=412133 RepID=A2DU77_TRIV3|nr:protein ubiquitination [Trichomonas vaginalis G3]EAY16070.1 hypothetical protein TVAG_278360 [Trichomonas vaginalis G3]KAI5537264.1 protein ubiquitination [Trichomonas vaginalis G3]|eukprot:XP_001328293.1 hypothetical protein [Trichomonas vaginalis G3]
MSDQDIPPTEYNELRNILKHQIDLYNALYQLKSKNDQELNSIYEKIKTILIGSKKYPPKKLLRDILNIIQYNNRYTKSYLKLAKLISDDYQIKHVENLPTLHNFLFYKEYGIKLNKYDDFEKRIFNNLDIQTEDTICRAIMDNDLERFIFFMEREEFDKDQKLICELYPLGRLSYIHDYSLLELCCYHGAVDCFKL